MHTSGAARILYTALCVTAAAALAACAVPPPAALPLAEPALPLSAPAPPAVQSPVNTEMARPGAIPGPAPSVAAPQWTPMELPELPAPAGEAAPVRERGLASWYGPRFHGRRAANGERYDMHALTAAHKTLPFNTLVRVRAAATGREVVVRITDRGRLPGRIIDLSRAAASKLGMLQLGLTEVSLFDVTPTAVRDMALEPAWARPPASQAPVGP